MENKKKCTFCKKEKKDQWIEYSFDDTVVCKACAAYLKVLGEEQREEMMENWMNNAFKEEPSFSSRPLIFSDFRILP